MPYGAAFRNTAWIDALQQNQENRSNLALVNTGEVDGGDSLFALEIYDGATGQLVNTVTGTRVPAQGWYQINGILDRYAPGTTQGYVRIRKSSGNNPFLAYGVINDGGAPGQRSGDGAYLPARETIIDPGTEGMTDREVLEALYHATGGPDWINRTNWLRRRTALGVVRGCYRWERPGHETDFAWQPAERGDPARTGRADPTPRAGSQRQPAERGDPEEPAATVGTHIP